MRAGSLGPATSALYSAFLSGTAEAWRVKGIQKRSFLCLEDGSWAFKQETWKIVDNPLKWPFALVKTLSVSLVPSTLDTGKRFFI